MSLKWLCLCVSNVVILILISWFYLGGQKIIFFEENATLLIRMKPQNLCKPMQSVPQWGLCTKAWPPLCTVGRLCKEAQTKWHWYCHQSWPVSNSRAATQFAFDFVLRSTGKLKWTETNTLAATVGCAAPVARCQLPLLPTAIMQSATPLATFACAAQLSSVTAWLTDWPRETGGWRLAD